VEEKQYILLYKPQGVVCTLSDPEGRKTVRDLLPEIKERVYPVGRWTTTPKDCFCSPTTASSATA
jgi:16S rRNA U516 pseudouridylate synthase RsuA-like enzyme